MAVASEQFTRPSVIDNDAGLDDYLETYQRQTFDPWRETRGIDFAAWQALGDDADERSYTTALKLGLPLVRLADLEPDPAAVALIAPQVARALRAVPLRARHGMVAVAMEDPGAANVQAMLDFLSRERIIPLVATARDMREGIARHYDRVEDLDVVRQLGMDPATAGEDVSE